MVGSETVIDYTVEYTAQRKAFGKTIADFQNTQFKLVELQTEAVVGRQFVDKCIALFIKGELDAVDAAMAKMWLSNMHCKVVDECLQLFGGWSYMPTWNIWRHAPGSNWAGRLCNSLSANRVNIVGRSW